MLCNIKVSHVKSQIPGLGKHYQIAGEVPCKPFYIVERFFKKKIERLAPYGGNFVVELLNFRNEQATCFSIENRYIVRRS
jgi:hypothetical protein